MALFFSLLIVQSHAQIGYNQQCITDKNCRETTDLLDICCAKLIYEANGVEIVSRSCQTKSEMESANGSFEYQGVTTTDAYCDGAFNAFTKNSIIFNTIAVLAAFLVSTSL